MTKNNKLKSNVLNFGIMICFGFVISYFVFPNGIFAQQKIPLVVAPARQTVAIDPGKSEHLQIKFFNETDRPISGNLKAVDFIVTGIDSSPILLEDQINDWIKLPYDRASIAPGGVLKVNFRIDVPKETLPGGRYSAIIFETVGQIQTGQSANSEVASLVSPRIVGLVNTRINGPITESAFIDLFKTPIFLEFGKIPVYFEIMNMGGYHINPKGQITLTNWMGQETERVTLEDKNIFPSAKRNYEVDLGQTWMFGKYKVDLVASYGEQGKTLTATNYVWVIPVTIIIMIIFSIIIVILLFYLISKGSRDRQEELEKRLEEEIREVEMLKNKFKDKLPKQL